MASVPQILRAIDPTMVEGYAGVIAKDLRQGLGMRVTKKQVAEALEVLELVGARQSRQTLAAGARGHV